MSEIPLLRGLAAQCTPACRVLVLGSMPGARSLQQAHYYAHPRNRFWPLMGDLLHFDAAGDYPARLAALAAAGVGLWDVIGQCERPGSLDAAIRQASIVPNPLPSLLERLPALRAIACNGAQAYRAWQRHIVPRLSPAQEALPVLALPSTSPANAAAGWPVLRTAWAAILPYLGEPAPPAAH